MPGKPGPATPPPSGDPDPLRRQRVIGILLVAAVILLFTLLRADWRGIFPPGWWHW